MCLTEVQDLVDEVKTTLGDAASMAGFRNLAVMDNLRKNSGSRAFAPPEFISAEGHELIPAWVPSPCDARARCAAFSTLRLSGYPWPGVLETAVEWARHHHDVGMSPLIVFLDEPDSSKVLALRSALGDLVDKAVDLVEEREMQAAWLEDAALWKEHGCNVQHELSAKQILNSAAALRRCQTRHPEVQWLFCNLDLDEAFMTEDISVPELFGAVPSNAWQLVYVNHEAVVSEGQGCSWFQQIDLFKVSPLCKLPFMSKRFPIHDEEPQVLEHPDGLGESTLHYWKEHNARLADQYGFKKRAGGGTCSYFDGYARGKTAIRLAIARERCAVPHVHRWQISDPKLETLVCSPAAAHLLHYINCGGLEWFAAKYAIRTGEEANRLWFHALAQERSKAGGKALQDLYDDVLSMPPDALHAQKLEGFVAELASPGTAAKAFAEFWGWAVVSLGGSLHVHIPLSGDLTGGSNPDVASMAARSPGTNATKLQEWHLSPGASLEGPVNDSGGQVPVLRLNATGLERGWFVLDVKLVEAKAEEQSAGLYLCVAKPCRAIDDALDNLVWASGAARVPEDGWRCRIPVHQWMQISSEIFVQFGCGGMQPTSKPPVSFEPLIGVPGTLIASCAQKFRAELHFQPEIVRLPIQLHAAYNSFYRAFKGVDGSQLSKGTAASQQDLELTYAEVEFVPFIEVLERAVQPEAGEMFLDLGSGTGRALLSVALGFPELRGCIGYEILEPLHTAAQSAVAAAQADDVAIAPVDLRLQSFHGVPWEEEGISILWVASLCMTSETLAEIRARARRLPRGARIVTMDPFFHDCEEGLEPVSIDGSARIPVEMSFGEASVYVVRRV
eukprot:TRINITY_DN31901_c0_g2_i1.p1 TRINITY_DN31901_c0_g2~~TRINITY_DN31901_c0_g2_i1.p1  ORF type:complete len:895 (-),score=141.13 TRINITY_DN31901_c0_g2_i1:693-3221(-)